MPERGDPDDRPIGKADPDQCCGMKICIIMRAISSGDWLIACFMRDGRVLYAMQIQTKAVSDISHYDEEQKVLLYSGLLSTEDLTRRHDSKLLLLMDSNRCSYVFTESNSSSSTISVMALWVSILRLILLHQTNKIIS